MKKILIIIALLVLALDAQVIIAGPDEGKTSITVSRFCFLKAGMHPRK